MKKTSEPQASTPTKAEIQWLNSVLAKEKLPTGPLGSVVKKLKAEMEVLKLSQMRLQQAEQIAHQSRLEIQRLAGSTQSLASVIIDMKRELPVKSNEESST